MEDYPKNTYNGETSIDISLKPSFSPSLHSNIFETVQYHPLDVSKLSGNEFPIANSPEYSPTSTFSMNTTSLNIISSDRSTGLEDFGGTQENAISKPLAPHASSRLIVKFNDNVNTILTEQIKLDLEVKSITKIGLTGAEIWQFSGTSVESALAKYGSSKLFEYVEPDYIVTTAVLTPTSTIPNDPSFSQLWGLNNTGQSGGTPDADIDAPEAWDIQKGDPNLVIGVIDTGVDYNHPDLAGNIWTNPGEIAGDGIDNDFNGYVDDIRGWDFAYGDNDPMDVDGHGTHVSGTIAAKSNNGVGVTGVAWNSKIMPLKFLDDEGFGFTSDAVLAVDYATAMGVKLTNNSWGGGGFSQALYDAIDASGQQGALFIAAAGNDNDDNDTTPFYPASYNLANIISVASTTRTDGLSSFSNYGQTSVDLGAPGSEILSTTPGNTYSTYSGTSMASPHVAGAAALLWSQNPTLTAQQVKNTLMQTGDSISSLAGKTVSGKRLNIYNAIVCFLSGTLIHTPSGERPIETLLPGDLICTAEGPQAVKFISRTTHFASALDNHDLLPIRIAAGAFGELGPVRDLYVSPGHAILFDGRLIHASVLVNGTTITRTTLEHWQDQNQPIQYLNIELERHHLITAEGLVVESFIDIVQRQGWDNYTAYLSLYGKELPIPELQLSRVAFKRQLPSAIRQRLQQLEASALAPKQPVAAGS